MSTSSEIPLIERVDELDVLERTVAGCLVRRAAPGPHEHQFPFGVIRTLLESPLREAPERERASLLSGPATAAGALLLAGAEPTNLAHGVTNLAHGVTWLCAGLAHARPLVLIVDDAHWSDRCSLQVLSYLAGRIEDLPLLILVAARIGDPRAADDLLTLLGAGRSATVLHPQPLTSMGATRLIRSLAPEASIHACAECHRATAGSPWLLGELARQIEAHGPGVIQQPERSAPRVTAVARAVVRRRVAELEPRDRAVASARAVIGDGAPPHAIAQVASVPLAELGPAHDALAAAGILGPDGEGIAHELIATAIRDDLAPAELERLHRESARALIGLGATGEVVASHLLDCRPHADRDISDWLERAGAEAVDRGAPGAAVAYLERALEEHTPVAGRGRLLASLTAAAFDAGAPDPRARLRYAVAETRDQVVRLDLLTRLTGYGVIFGGNPADVELLTRELEDPRTGPESQPRVQAALLDGLLAPPERHAQRARCVAAIDLGAAGDPVVRRVALAHRAWLDTERGTAGAQACAAMALDALDGGFLLREAGHRAAYHLCVAVLIATDHVRQAHRAVDALREYALARGSMPMRAAAAAYAAELSMRAGRPRDAETPAREALELARRELERARRGSHPRAGSGTRRARRVRGGA